MTVNATHRTGTATVGLAGGYVAIDLGPGYPELVGLTAADARGLASDLLWMADLLEMQGQGSAGKPGSREAGSEEGRCPGMAAGREAGKPAGRTAEKPGNRGSGRP